MAAAVVDSRRRWRRFPRRRRRFSGDGWRRPRMGGGGLPAGGGGFHAKASRGGNFHAAANGRRARICGAPHGAARLPHRPASLRDPDFAIVASRACMAERARSNVQPGVNRNLNRAVQGHGPQRLMGQRAAPLARRRVTHAQFAHNQFAAHNFHGLANFNRTGFNRQRLRRPAALELLRRSILGRRMASLGPRLGRLGRPGFWPYLYGDIFSFAFWPTTITIRSGAMDPTSCWSASLRRAPFRSRLRPTPRIIRLRAGRHRRTTRAAVDVYYGGGRRRLPA